MDTDITFPSWHPGEEFEGQKRPNKYRTPEKYEYAHGPICNGLFRCLNAVLVGRGDLQVRKNANIDAAVVLTENQRASIIFEVKTSADLGSQVYSAIGQLFIYKYFHGCSTCTLALVLPRQFEEDAKKLNVFLTRFGIHTIVGDGAEFKTLAGQSLQKFVIEHGGA